jgi:hypothetical protein
MTEEITNEVATETQAVDITPEENAQATEGQVATQEGEVTDVEKCNDVAEGDIVEEKVNEPTNEELKARLKEYEVKAEEEKLIRQKLGLPEDMDSTAYNYMNVEQQVINQGKSEYLRLCTEYGVDADPAKLDASIEQLKATDPAKGYEFLRRFEALGNDVAYKRNQIQSYVTNYEIGKFSNEYNDLLTASPALNNIVAQYVQNYSGQGNMYNQLHNVMDIIIPAYKEAFEAGRSYAMTDNAKKDTTAVQGGIATTPTTTSYSDSTVFTRDQIRRMSSDDFAKYEKVIQQQIREGKIK